MFSKKLIFSAFAVAASLTGCGGTGQDDGRSYNIQAELSGRVVDGHVVRTTVFVDTNNNGTRDAWEPKAFTDNLGYFSYNPKTDTNYCADTATAAQKEFCLVLRTDATPVVVRVDSGYDLSTGEPFVGQMARKVEVNSTGRTEMLISPLTTLVTLLDNSEDRARLLTVLGLEESDLDVDYLDEENLDPELMNIALKVHKIVTVLADRLTDTYQSIGDELGTPNDATQEVYRSMGQSLLVSDLTASNFLGNSENLNRVVQGAEDGIRDIYDRRELTQPILDDTLDSTRISEVAAMLPSAVDRIIPPQPNSINRQEALGSARLLESIIIKALRDDNGSDTSITNAFDFLMNASSELVNALRDALSTDSAYVSGLVANDFTGDDFDDSGDFEDAVTLPQGAMPFSEIAGKKVRLSDTDLGSAPNNLKDIEVIFYFEGSGDQVEGELVACAKYIDGANSSGTLGEGNTRGTLINGFWSMLGASESSESYSILTTITFLGATYQAIIKPAGYLTVDGEPQFALRFDFEGEIRDWVTENGLETFLELPRSDDECVARLPSRVNI